MRAPNMVIFVNNIFFFYETYKFYYDFELWLYDFTKIDTMPSNAKQA